MVTKRNIPEDAWPPLLGGLRFRYDRPAFVSSRSAERAITANSSRIEDRYVSAFWDAVAPMQPKVLADSRYYAAGVGQNLRHFDVLSSIPYDDWCVLTHSDEFLETIVDEYDVVVLTLQMITGEIIERAAEKNTLVICKSRLSWDPEYGYWAISNPLLATPCMISSVSVEGVQWSHMHELTIDSGSLLGGHYIEQSSDPNFTTRPAFFWDI